MAEVVCVDGSRLAVLPVPKLDRGGVAYEATLRLLLDGAPFGAVGECSAWRLERTAARLREAQSQDGPQALPVTGVDALLDAASSTGDEPAGRSASDLRRLLPRDRELLCLRARDPDDGDPSGELRLWLREERAWVTGAAGGRGRWSTRSAAVLDAWGAGGRGVRCVLDGPALLALLDTLVAEAVRAVGSGCPRACTDGPGAGESSRAHVGTVAGDAGT